MLWKTSQISKYFIHMILFNFYNNTVSAQTASRYHKRQHAGLELLKLLKCRFWLSRSGLGLTFYIFNKLLDNTDGPGTMFWIVRWAEKVRWPHLLGIRHPAKPFVQIFHNIMLVEWINELFVMFIINNLRQKWLVKQCLARDIASQPTSLFDITTI